MTNQIYSNELIDSTIQPYEGIPTQVLDELADCLLEMVNLAGFLAEQWGAELSAEGHDCSTDLCEATKTIQATIKKLETRSWN